MQSLKTVIVATTIAVAGLTHAASTSQTISTELNEVRAGNFDGIEYLDLHISSQVGPVTCRNNVVSVNVEKYTEKTDHDIEVIALQAMVKSEAVLITVQLAKDDCIDGKPLVSELKVLPRSTHF